MSIFTIKKILRSKHQKIKNADISVLSKNSIQMKEEQLKQRLNEAGIRFTSISKYGVFLRQRCAWSTIVTISNLDLDFDILVSGGGSGYIDSSP